HHLIELPDRRTLVAAKVWVSPYPIGVLIIHTKRLRRTLNAWQFYVIVGFCVFGGLRWHRCCVAHTLTGR
ncbi:hypothetical protein, partial [Vibrio europaeus]|uniref:hypothetical protein n=1 Tax=Vibrio europaeus TaxID=300876 RepID=UPI0023708A3A|nr:hypothetical protein [Vibrio europaeus]